MKQSMFLKIYIWPGLMLSTMTSISTNSWFTIWIMLEFNLMSFIPLLIFLNKFNKEISFKYFIIQAFSSSILLISIINLMLNFNSNLMFNYLMLIMNLSIMMKLGMAPLHSWYINIMMNCNWLTCLILSTWQKIIPLILLNYIFMDKINYIFIIYTIFYSSIYNLNHQSIRIIMSLSSLNHLSWILLTMMINEFISMMYFLIYCIMNVPLMLNLYNYKIFYLNQLYNMNFNKISKLLYFNLLSISGTPPMMGFLLKWMSLNLMNICELYLIMMLILIMSILMFLIYMRISIPLITHKNFKNKLNKYFPNNSLNLYNILLINFTFLTLWMIILFYF